REAGLARADEHARLAVPHADAAEQPGQERAVDLLRRRRLRAGHEAHLAHHADQLIVDVLPLAHALVRQEVLAAELDQLARAPRARLLPELPDREQAEEVALLAAEPAVRRVRRPLLPRRGVARGFPGGDRPRGQPPR